jgi:hypothetical protein
MFPHINTQQNVPYILVKEIFFKIIINIPVISYHKDTRKRICRSFYRILIYVLKMEIQLSRREGWDPEVMCVDMWIHLFSMNIKIIVDFLIDCLTGLGYPS